MTELHRLLWAKSAKKETPDNWKLVLVHLLDVVACGWRKSDGRGDSLYLYCVLPTSSTRRGCSVFLPDQYGRITPLPTHVGVFFAITPCKGRNTLITFWNPAAAEVFEASGELWAHRRDYASPRRIPQKKRLRHIRRGRRRGGRLVPTSITGAVQELLHQPSRTGTRVGRRGQATRRGWWSGLNLVGGISKSVMPPTPKDFL